jgi:hypothetical protein
MVSQTHVSATRYSEERMIMKTSYIMIVIVVASIFGFVSGALCDDYRGTVRAGYIFTDLEGNEGVHQPTFNLYDGVALSLENFHYNWDSGLRLSANIINPTLKNRRFKINLRHRDYAGVTFRHSAYRRTYDFDGDKFTRRKTTSGSFWVRPAEFLRLFGSAGVLDKNGTLRKFTGNMGTADIDYMNTYLSGGAEFKHDRTYGRIEYMASDYDNDIVSSDQRSSSRIKLTAYTPFPTYENVVLGAGFQHYENIVELSKDTLSANTVWGLAKYSHELGYTARYTFMFDRASRTGDLVATDRILNAFSVSKAWRGRGGVSVGYGHEIRDDAKVERSGDQFSISGWAAPTACLTLRAGYGFVSDNVDSGTTLTGDRDYARHWISARYKCNMGYAQVKIDNRSRDHDDIGSEVDFVRFAFSGSYSLPEYGNVNATYSFGNGEYSNTSGEFDYKEHVLTGDISTIEYHYATLGFGGTYYRSKQDVDVESFTVRFSGKYRIHEKTALEIIYSAHNFDNFDDPSPYTEYYTANVVEANVVFEL